MSYEIIKSILIIIFFPFLIDRIRYYCIHKKNCVKCLVNYDSLNCSHCCNCKKVYLSYFGDGDGWCCFYNHCCDCNCEYDSEMHHICKKA
jgi:hypothetical protein